MGSAKFGNLKLNARGVTLIELMVTVAILGIGVIAGLGSFRYVSTSLQMSKTKTLATNLAQEQVEKLKNLSYYMLLVTTATASDARFTPALDYDTGNYPPQTLYEGGIRFVRSTRVDFAFQSGTVITTAPWTNNDTGLKQITTYITWMHESTPQHLQITNLMANPAANPLNATFTGTVRDTSSNPIAGALVEVVGNANWYALTNAAGVYSFSVSQGSYTLMCSTHGFFPSTTNGYLSIVSGQSVTANFTLGRMSSGTAVGSVFINDHLVISQVVGSSVNSSGFSQEYVEVFNPSSYTWTVASSFGVPYINLIFDQQGSGGPTTIAMNYSTFTIASGGYYLFANTETITAGGVTRTADAVFSTSNSGYPNIIKINSDSGNNAAAVGLAYAGTGVWIDRVGWRTAGNDPPFYETAALNEVVGLELGEQYVRRSSTAGVVTGQGRAYDSNDNEDDFVISATVLYPPRNSSDMETIISGTPASGAYVFFNDPLSQTGNCVNTFFGSQRLCRFNVPSIATGTWTMTVASGTYFSQTNNVVITANTVIGAPNSATSPSWPLAGHNTILLRNTTEYAFLSGVITNAANVPLSGILVGAGGNTASTSSSGRYFISVSTGDIQLTANYNNSNKAYTSQSVDLFALQPGMLYDNPSGGNRTWFTLSLGGILRGYIKTSSNTPLPGRVAVALQGGNQAGQGTSGSDGYFYIANLTTGTYVIQPTLDPAESATPTSTTVTLASTGTTTNVSTFTVISGLAEVTGQTLLGTTPITTGVLVVASTVTLSGGSTSPPPPQYGSTGMLCNPCTYAGSSDSLGTYSINVRSSTTPYKLYGWYTTFTNSVPTVSRQGPYNVTISSAGQIYSQNLVW